MPVGILRGRGGDGDGGVLGLGGWMPSAGDAKLRAVPVRGGDLRDVVRKRWGMRRGVPLRRRSLPGGYRPGTVVRRGERLHERLLRRWGLLRYRLRRGMRDVHRGDAGDVLGGDVSGDAGKRLPEHDGGV